MPALLHDGRTSDPSRAPTLAALHHAARSRLRQAGCASPEIDARLLVEHFTGTSATDSIARPHDPVERAAAEAVDAALLRRVRGEPVHRIIGYREFYGLRLALSADTLEPRPDTEILVDALLPCARRIVAAEGSCRVLDLGTGTGAIALALAAEVPGVLATGVDISAGALATALQNARAVGLEGRFTAICSDWLEKISGRYHVIASNPPYIPTNELSTLQSEVRDFDPARALDGGADGLDPYRVIAGSAGNHLAPGGVIGIEIGKAAKHDVTGIFGAAGYAMAEQRRDLAGHERVLVFHRR